MKRLDLVQLTIIIIGLISAFFCLRLVPGFLIYMFSWFSGGLKGGYIMEAFIENIILIACYLLFSLFTVRNSKQLAGWVSTKANLQSDINFALNKTELLFALFLGLGLYGLIDELPLLLIKGYNFIKEANSHSLMSSLSAEKIPKELVIRKFITVSLFLILVIYAKAFAEFFAAKINNTEPVDEINDVTA